MKALRVFALWVVFVVLWGSLAVVAFAGDVPCGTGDSPYRVSQTNPLATPSTWYYGDTPQAACAAWAAANGYASPNIDSSTRRCTASNGTTSVVNLVLSFCKQAEATAAIDPEAANVTVCSSACTVTHVVEIPILNLTVEQGQLIALAILALWALAWGIRACIQAIRGSGGDSSTLESDT